MLAHVNYIDEGALKVCERWKRQIFK